MENRNRFNIRILLDRPGIRPSSLKNCPLRCLWCSNPESDPHPQLAYNKKVLTQKCVRCIEICSAGAKVGAENRVGRPRDLQ
jgi:pyruvate formate lyase activating enzyme